MKLIENPARPAVGLLDFVVTSRFEAFLVGAGVEQAGGNEAQNPVNGRVPNGKPGAASKSGNSGEVHKHFPAFVHTGSIAGLRGQFNLYQLGKEVAA